MMSILAKMASVQIVNGEDVGTGRRWGVADREANTVEFPHSVVIADSETWRWRLAENEGPFSQRVLLTLEEKHLPYDLKLVDLANRPEWFIKVSPEGKVPVAKLDEKWIADSDIITQTIEEKFPEPPLATPPEKSSVGSKLFSTFIAFLKSQDPNDGTEKALLSELTLFNEYLRENGPFVNGEKISASDLSLGPKLYHLEIVLDFYKNWSVPESFTHVRNYMECLILLSAANFLKGIFCQNSSPERGCRSWMAIESRSVNNPASFSLHNQITRSLPGCKY